VFYANFSNISAIFFYDIDVYVAISAFNLKILNGGKV
jgi:hypothetical protein